MLGHRGVRLGITYPEITEMQTRAIIEAACQAHKEGLKVVPEIMIPLVGILKEFSDQKAIVDRVAADVMKEQRIKIKYLVGTMIEIPARLHDCRPDRPRGRVLLVRHQRSHPADVRFLARRRRKVPEDLPGQEDSRAATRSRRSTSKASAISCASASNAAARHGPISSSASAASTAATRRRSISSTTSGSITSAPAPTAFRSRGLPRHRPRCL